MLQSGHSQLSSAESQGYGCLTTSSVQHRLPLRPGLLDLSTIGSEQEVLREDGSPCVPETSGEGIRPNSRRVYTSPRDIPKLDYGFPKDFGQWVWSSVIAVFCIHSLVYWQFPAVGVFKLLEKDQTLARTTLYYSSCHQTAQRTLPLRNDM